MNETPAPEWTPEPRDSGPASRDELEEEFSQAERLHVLLFLLREKLDQRRSLYHKATMLLMVLMVVCLAGIVFGPYYIESVSSDEYTFWTWAYFGALAVGPFAIAIINYFWTTFAQIFYKGLPDIRAVIETPEYAQFSNYIPMEPLTDDGSFLSLFLNLFGVDVGLSTSLFWVGAAMLLLGPLLVQAGLSLAVIHIAIRDKLEVFAIGLTVLYILFLTMTGIKTLSFYHSLRRGSGKAG